MAFISTGSTGMNISIAIVLKRFAGGVCSQKSIAGVPVIDDWLCHALQLRR
jgi:hypothetical protein